MVHGSSTIQLLAPFARSIDLDFLIAEELIDDHYAVDKFAEVTLPLKDVTNDVWSPGGTWVAPTEQRVHNLVSTDAADTFGGAGAQVTRVTGLETWASPEAYWDIEMAGLGNAPTIPLVMINRMEVVEFGGSGSVANVGQIEAVAAVDLTTTSMIIAGRGQTQQSIYGVPSGYALLLKKIYGSILSGGPAARAVNFEMLLATKPETLPTVFIRKWSFGLTSNATSAHLHDFEPPRHYEGPAIVKLTAISDVNDVHVDAGFDGIVAIEPEVDE